WYRFMPDWRILVLPAFVLLAVCTTVGPALWITALNVKYRDFRYIIPFIIQFGGDLLPGWFCSNLVTPHWGLVLSLKPLCGGDRRIPLVPPGRAERTLCAGLGD